MDLGGMVYAEPAVMVAVAAQLEGIADRMNAAQQAHSLVVHAGPAGAEEVSLTVSRNQRVVADSFDVAATTGAAQLRRAAESLRMQAGAYVSTDAATASVVAPLY